MNANSQEWRDVPGFNGDYKCTPDGRVRGPRKILKPFPADNGAVSVVNLYHNGRMSRLSVRSIVRITFGNAAAKGIARRIA